MNKTIFLFSSLLRARRSAERQGYRSLPLGDPRDPEDDHTVSGGVLPFHDDDGDGLVVSLGDCAAGWSLRPKTQQVFQFDQVYGGNCVFAKLFFNDAY